MTTTTTIRLTKELKERIASAAEQAGKTTHSFMLEALVEKAEREEQRANFDAEANARFAKIVTSGDSIPWSEARRYLEARLSGQHLARPVPKRHRI